MPIEPRNEGLEPIDRTHLDYLRIKAAYAAERSLALQVGEALRAARKQAGLTQVALAELSGVSRIDISYLERGMRNLTMKRLERLAAVLHLRIQIDLVPIAEQAVPQPADRPEPQDPDLPLAI